MTTIILLISSVFIMLFLIIVFFSGKAMNIERSITINKPKQQVFDFIRYVKNHDSFSVWAKMDPDMKKEYRGIDGQVGFVFAWESFKKKNVGTGEQEIKKIEEGINIEHELRFLKPMQSTAKAKFITELISENQTKVLWGFYSTMKFPMNVMKPLVRNMLGKNLETGLADLKTVLEK